MHPADPVCCIETERIVNVVRSENAAPGFSPLINIKVILIIILGQNRNVPCESPVASFWQKVTTIVSLPPEFLSVSWVKYPSEKQDIIIIAARAGKPRHLLPLLIDFYLTGWRSSTKARQATLCNLYTTTTAIQDTDHRLASHFIYTLISQSVQL